MRLDTIIRILDNKEYDKIQLNGEGYFRWHDVFLPNGEVIRFEHFGLYEEDEYRAMYFNFTSEGDRALEMWEGDYRENSYYIFFENLFNDAMRYYNSINGVE